MGYEQVMPHPQYDPNNNNRHHDIALIRMSADVTYSDFIRPVCLPLASTRQAINVGELLTVAGWGRTLLGKCVLSISQYINMLISAKMSVCVCVCVSVKVVGQKQ